MIVYSLNQAPNERLSFAWQGFTTEWYRRLFEIPDLTSALVTSLEIAALSTVIAVAIGTPAALALARYRFRGRGTGDLVILADIAAPSVVVGASLLGLFVYLGVNRGFGTILIAHVAFNVAFVVIVLQARLRDIDPSLSEAARDLGSSPIQAFWLITVPVIFPAILSAVAARRGALDRRLHHHQLRRRPDPDLPALGLRLGQGRDPAAGVRDGHADLPRRRADRDRRAGHRPALAASPPERRPAGRSWPKRGLPCPGHIAGPAGSVPSAP